ncbi:MAG: LysR family transcriptional regulator [Thermodesulfobacteriota bacterium]
MNLNQLKAFYFVVKYKSMTAAAEALYITQPAVTKAIGRLEDHYGLKFLNRFGKKWAPTDAGKVLYEIADELFKMEGRAEQTIREFQQRTSGSIRIHACETVGAYFLPYIITDFNKANPQIRVSLEILPNDQVIGNTVLFNNDLGFVSHMVEHEKLEAREILEDRLVLITPSGHPLGSKKSLEEKDLAGQPFILHEKGSFTRTIVDEFIEHSGLSLKVSLEISSNEFIKRAVERGAAVAIISESVARDEIQSGRLKATTIANLSVNRKLYMIHHRDKYFSPPLKTLVETTFQWCEKYSRSTPSLA